MSILNAIGHTPLVELKARLNPNPRVRILAKPEGNNPGGAAVAGALEVAARLPRGTVVTLLPDRGDRYLSTMFFRSVCAKCPP